MKNIRYGSAVLGLLLCGNGVAAQQSAGSEGKKALTPEASLNIHFLSDLQLAPDGSRLAFVVSEAPKGEKRVQHIWMYEKQSNSARQFTYSAKSETSPRWSPDGKRLAFLSNRGGDEQQIYVMNSGEGEGVARTKGKSDIKTFEWSKDGKYIAYIAPDAKNEEEQKKEKDKNDARVADKDEKHPRLWLMPADSGDSRAITPASWEIKELAWMPEGESVVVAGTDHPESDQNTDRIFSVPIPDGAMKPLVAPRGPFGKITVSPDGKAIGFIGSRGDGPSPHDLMLLPVRNPATRNLTGLNLDRQIFDYKWLDDGGLVAITGDGFHTRLKKFGAAGAMTDVDAAVSVNPSAFAVAHDGKIFFVSQTATQPQELFVWDQNSIPRQVTRVNDAWKQYALVAPEYYKYKSFDGLEIEAALLKPAALDGKSKVPLIALIHGGPTGAWEDTVDPWGQLLVARGYAVFYPNIRGSIGYGQKFIEMNRGDWGGGDFKDVMAGVDDLIARGIADPEKLGIGGWSYGGYMAEWAITQTTRFKAAVSGAGLSNLISEYGTEEGPSYDEWFYGVPYEPEKVAGFLNSSPFVHLKNAKTPTLILQGEADTVDPVGQSMELYRGLKRYGVETELVLYPREPHGFHEEKHLVDRLNRILAWYDKYLKKEMVASSEIR
ncbi:MAG: S9 family peptidase [Acidobacteriota bacterium]|nr:S9 family peptidase [Acidobacteriota bacterium]